MQVAFDLAAVSSYFVTKMLMIVPLVFILIGLIDPWLPEEIIEKHIGEGSGIKGTFLLSFLPCFRVAQYILHYHSLSTVE